MSTEYSSDFSSALLPEPNGAARRGGRALDVKRLIRRRWPLMLALFLVLAVPGALAAWLLVPLQYTATAMIQCLASNPAVMYPGAQGGRTDTPFTTFLNTQVNYLRSPQILSRVLDIEAVRSLPVLANAEDSVSLLQRMVNARIQPNSELITITCTAPDPATAEIIVDAVRDRYLVYQMQNESTIDTVRRGELEKNARELEYTLDKQMQAIREKRDAVGAPNTEGPQYGPSETVSYRSGLADAEAELLAAEMRLAQQQELVERIEVLRGQYAGKPAQKVYELGVEDRVSSDAKVGQLRGQLASLEAQLALKEDDYSSQDIGPLKVLRDDIRALSAKLVQEEGRARGEALRVINETAKRSLEEAGEQVTNAADTKTKFEAMIQEQQDKTLKVFQDWNEIKELEQEAEDTRTKLEEVRDRIYRFNIEQGAPARVSEAGDVTVPTRPDLGARLQWLLLIFVGAGLVSASVGVWRELSDQQVRSSLDINAITSLPVLALIPHTSEDRLPKSVEPGLLTADYPASTMADEYRRILARIIYPAEGIAELTTCLVASPSRGDGKTSVASNLAVALAQANRRVLLVDISSRRPSVETLYGMEPSVGLSEVLCGEYELSEVVRPTELPNLSVLGPGFRKKELIGKLASREITDFFENAEQLYEHVIVDSPPLLLMSDARLLAPIVDGVIVVVGAGAATLGMTKRCLDELQQLGAHVVGVVLNGVKSTRGGYLKRNLQLYYGYSDHRGRASRNGREDEEIPEVQLAPVSAEADHEEPVVMLLDDRGQNKEKAE
jgi:polysaccharide biosynthesis transport protein